MRRLILPCLGTSACGSGPSGRQVSVFWSNFRGRPATQARPARTRAETGSGYDSSVHGLIAPPHHAAGARRYGSYFWRGLLTLAVVAAVLAPSRARAQCVDEALKQQLVGERAYR